MCMANAVERSINISAVPNGKLSSNAEWLMAAGTNFEPVQHRQERDSGLSRYQDF